MGQWCVTKCNVTVEYCSDDNFFISCLHHLLGFLSCFFFSIQISINICLHKVARSFSRLHFHPWRGWKTRVLSCDTEGFGSNNNGPAITWDTPVTTPTPTFHMKSTWGASNNHSHYFWDAPCRCIIKKTNMLPDFFSKLGLKMRHNNLQHVDWYTWRMLSDTCISWDRKSLVETEWV